MIKLLLDGIIVGKVGGVILLTVLIENGLGVV
jgi:hypothetical protein